MAKKWITAQEILSQKGFSQNKFDTNGFNETVGKFFLDNKVESTLMIVPKRFVAMENAPSCGYIDMTDVSIWQKRVEDPSDPLTFIDYIQAVAKGLVRPMVYVDEPFVKNVAHLLSLMGGYVVKKQRGGKYLVSLL